MNDEIQNTFEFIAHEGAPVAPYNTLPVIYRLETFHEVIADIKPLLQHHWDEIALHKDKIPYAPDWKKYARFEQMGGLRVYTARLDGILVGYIVFFRATHPHYMTTIHANADIFWIEPIMRGDGIGPDLFRFAEKSLADEGTHAIHITSKVAHPAARKMLEALGYELIEYGHAKVINSG